MSDEIVATTSFDEEFSATVDSDTTIEATLTDDGSASGSITTDPSLDASMVQTGTVSAMVNDPIVTERFKLEELINVNSSAGLITGYIVTYDASLEQWVVGPPPPVDYPVTPYELLIAGDVGSDIVRNTEVLHVLGGPGIRTTVTDNTITVELLEIDGGSY